MQDARKRLGLPLLAVVLAVGLLWLDPRPRELRVADALAESGKSALDGAEWTEHGWPRTRGPARRLGETERDNAKRAFRLGVHSVDLEAAMLLENREVAVQQARQMRDLVGELDFSQLWVYLCQDLGDKIESGGSYDEIALNGGTVTLSSPCTITPEGASVTLF